MIAVGTPGTGLHPFGDGGGHSLNLIIGKDGPFVLLDEVGIAVAADVGRHAAFQATVPPEDDNWDDLVFLNPEEFDQCADVLIVLSQRVLEAKASAAE